ncbi:hypothetical protein R4530_13135 [Acinetobacter baumannii]|nr:hypothetical protein [Acinetobacter baumannii]
MLFTDTEINKLECFAEIAQIINRVHNDTAEIEHVVNNYNSNIYATKTLFLEIKSFIMNLDVFIREGVISLNGVDKTLRILEARALNRYELQQEDKERVLNYFINIFANFLISISAIRISEFRSLYDSLKMVDDNFETLFTTIKGLSTEIYEANFQTDYQKKIVLLDEDVLEIKRKIEEQNNIIFNEVNKFIEPKKEELNNYINNQIQEFQDTVTELKVEIKYSVRDNLSKLRASVTELDKDFKETYDDYEILKKLINAKGEQQITDHYKKRAFWERITYWLMTIGTFGIIIWSICLALNGLDEYKAKTSISISSIVQQYKGQPIENIEKIYSVAQNNALTYLVLRLIFSVLLFSSIIYTSRVAYRAYIHMRHSENMMLKLATLRPFINQLNEDERNQIHKDLVPDYFGKDAGIVDSTNEKFKDLPANVSAVAIKAIEQISGSGSNSSTEKNGKKSEGGTE